jgi:alpha-amylase
MGPLPFARLRYSIAVLRAAGLSLAFGIALGAAPAEAADNPPIGWWRDATFYEIFVRSFADAQDGPLAGDGIGDLQGLSDHLDYLNDGRGAAGRSLGVTALWLMPIQPSPSYHGYDVTDYFSVNPQYGDIALMKAFVAAAHRHGIRVIIDLVLNHSSSAHPLFRQAVSPNAAEAAAARAMYRFAAAPGEPKGPWGQRVWHPAAGVFYYGVFTSEMPDWNFRTPAVTEHHRRAAVFWLRDVGVDGFRLDAVRYFIETGTKLEDTEETRQWLREFTAYCHQIKPGAFVVGEDTGGMNDVSRYIRGGSLDSAFEFDLARRTIAAVHQHDATVLTGALERLGEIYSDDAPWSSFLSNHDQDRVRTQLGDDDAESRLAAKLLFTLPGVTFIYYGEELGLRGAKPDPELRTPLPWTAQPPNAGFTAPAARPWHAVTPDFPQRNVATESAANDSLLALYRQLVRLRANSPALRHGRTLHPATNDPEIFVSMRSTDAEVALVVANFSATPHAAPEFAIAQTPARTDWQIEGDVDAAHLSPPALDAAGGFSHWRPAAELAPESVTVIRWLKR